ncbi:hypothetical protein [Brevibacillus brevis]|nr:hypothetical protein [Brevibacillus brevis]WJQ78949.1 hypothetical protein QN310_15630 [Brevibacillus brevis]
MKKPERVVILNTEVLGLFYQLGGAAIARAKARTRCGYSGRGYRGN